MDGEFGKCLELLNKYNLTENTIVVFTSEQGNSFPFAKWTCYGNGLQTAFIVNWPGKIKPGSVSDAMIEYVDVTPTFIEMAGLKIPGNLDGKSFLPLLLGKKKTHKKFVYGIQTTRGVINGADYYGIRTVRSDSFRYIMNLTPEATFKGWMTENATFKSWIDKASSDSTAKDLVYKYQHRPAEELYAVVNDPFEMNNIVDDPRYTNVKEELKDKLLKWMEQQGDKGQKTELEAFEHLTKNQKKNQLIIK